VAVTLLSQKHEPLIVFLITDAAATQAASTQASQFHGQVDAVIQEQVNQSRRDVAIDYRVLSASSVSALIRHIQSEQVGILVLPSRISILQRDGQNGDDLLPTLLEALDIPVLLVR
jgi:hypothetical protein